jgi:hypothetical protein
MIVPLHPCFCLGAPFASHDEITAAAMKTGNALGKKTPLSNVKFAYVWFLFFVVACNWPELVSI